MASFSDAAFSGDAFSVNAFSFGSSGAIAGADDIVVWKLDIVNTNRNIAAQDTSRDIGFLERNKEVDFQDG
jgi:hypothetical protein